MQQLLEMTDSSLVDASITAKLDRITRSVKDLAELLEHFSRRNLALVSVAESLDTASSTDRLVMHLLIFVSQWERETRGKLTRHALQFKNLIGRRIGGITFGLRLSFMGSIYDQPSVNRSSWHPFSSCERVV